VQFYAPCAGSGREDALIGMGICMIGKVHEISAFILAGGKSSRMGSDKAFLELNGLSLLARAVALATKVTEQVKIVGDANRFRSFEHVIADVYPGRGPLGGIHAALASSQSELNLILGVDLPFVDIQVLNFLLAQAKAFKAVVTVPFIGGHYQTLCAVYRKEFSTVAESALAEGRNKIDALFAKVPLRVVDEPELTRAGLNLSAFRNVNTPEEWEQAKRDLDSSTQHYDGLETR
jgi:molybdopterin-guanine dinucleotide biosynthesis protein A